MNNRTKSYCSTNNIQDNFGKEGQKLFAFVWLPLLEHLKVQKEAIKLKLSSTEMEFENVKLKGFAVEIV
jgi:hypothetical protein